jgi:general secretion pathway protein N
MKRLALLGVACYLLALVIVFPAAPALRWLAPDALAVQGPTGSIWRGEAQAASYDGYYLGKLHWSLRPGDLLRARVAYHLEAQGPNGFVDGVFAVTPAGTLHISTLTGAAPLQALASVLPKELPVSLFTGRAQLKLDELRLESGWPRSASGQVEVVDLALVAPVETLGNYEMQLAGGGDEEPLRGDFHDAARDPPAPLEIKGTITLNPDRTYALKCTARARPNASDNIKASVGFICPPT